MWQVLWSESAERELCEIWLGTADRQSVTDAANEIDQLLKRDPRSVGESRAAGFRILFVPPLVVQYAVVEAERTVRVLQCVATSR